MNGVRNVTAIPPRQTEGNGMLRASAHHFSSGAFFTFGPTKI
jgi:hypothetical protein